MSHLVTFSIRSYQCMLQRESFEKITTIAALLKKFCRLLACMLFSLNFGKFIGIFRKVFAAYKQVRDYTALLYHIAGILLLLSTTINFWYLSKVSVLNVSKT